MYYPLDETRNLADRTKNGQNMLKYYGDDIPIMVVDGNDQNDLWKRHDLSPLRRFCLFSSVLLCVVTIIIFLYVLPCDNSMICPSVNEPQSSISWDKTLQGVGKFNKVYKNLSLLLSFFVFCTGGNYKLYILYHYCW